MNTNKSIMKKLMPIIIVMMMPILFIACEKSDAIQGEYVPKPDTLMPVYTDTGAEVIAFRVNGRMVISEDRVRRTRGFASGFGKELDNGSFWFFFEGGYRASDRSEGVRIYIYNIVDTGIYILKESTYTNRNQGQYYIGPNVSLAAAYTTRDNLKGYVHLKKIDTLKRIIAGTFEFDAKIFNWFGPENDSLSITDGIFDMTY